MTLSIDEKIEALEKQINEAKDRLVTLQLIHGLQCISKQKSFKYEVFSDTVRNEAKHKKTCRAKRKKRKKRKH